MAEKAYNLDYLESISGGDGDFVKDMIQTFMTNVPEDLNKLKSLATNENWRQVGEDAHRFASSLLFLGLNELKNKATEIEALGINQTNVELIPHLLDQLEKGCYQIIEELKRDFIV